MKTKLNQARTYSKKTLSTILAIVMLIMTCSVAFGVSAYTTPSSSDTVFEELAAALQSTVALDLADSENATTSGISYTQGSNGSSSTTNTITTTTYETYLEVLTIVDLVFEAADYAQWWCADGSERDHDYAYNGVVDVELKTWSTSVDYRKLYGENMYSTNQTIKLRLESLMGSALYNSYGVSTIIDIIFEAWESNDRVTQKKYDNSAIDHNSYSTADTLYFYLQVSTTDVMGWMAANEPSDYKNMQLGTTYTVVQHIKGDVDSYQPTIWSDTTYAYAYCYTFTSNTDILGNVSKLDVSAATNFVATASAYETYMDSFLAYTSFEEAYEHYKEDVTAFENEYNAMVAAQQSMKTTLGGSTYLISMFTNGLAYETVMDNYEIAMDAGLYEDAALGWYDYETNYAEYGEYNYDDGETFGDGVTLNADYIDFTTNYYDILMGATDSAKTYFMTTYDLDTNYYTEFTNNVNAYKAAAIKVELDALVDQYADIDAETLEESEQQIVYTAVDSYLTTLSKYDSKITSDATLFEEDDFSDYYDLEAKYACSVNSTVSWFYTWGNATYNEYTTTELLNVLDEYDSYVTKLAAFETSLATTVGEERAAELLTSAWAYTDEVTGIENSIIKYLASRLSGQVSAAVTMYESINVDSYTDIDVITFANLKASVGAVDTEIYDLLAAEGYWVAGNGYVSSTDISNYASLSTIMTFYTKYAATLGFDTYFDSSEAYTYSSRAAYETVDVVKSEEDVTYDVDTEAINNIITTIDSLLQDEAILTVVGELLGVDMSSGISDIIKDLIEDMLFSDDIISLIVGTIYPALYDILIEFGDTYLPTYVEFVDLDGNWYSIFGDLLSVEIEYADTLPELLGAAGVGATPEDVADHIDKTLFPDVYSALKTAGNSWYSANIYSVATGTWSLKWGIDDLKESGASVEEVYSLAISALGNALQSLYPALGAMLCGQAWSTSLSEAATATYLGVDHEGDVNIDLSACDGYVNVFGAIYELFGYYSYCGTTWIANNVSSATDFVNMVFKDIYGLLDYIMEAPVERIMDALPNVVYALMFDMLPEMLNLLYTDLTYVADGQVFGVDAFGISNLYAGTEPLIVGELLNLSDLGLDTSDGIYFIFDLIGIDVDGLNEGLLATLGSLEEVSQGTNNIDQTKRNEFIYTNDHNGAWHIEADTEDVFYYIITFLIDYVKSGDLYVALSGLVDAETIAKVKAIVDKLGFNETYVSSGDVVAAIAELFEPLNYGDEGYFTLSSVAADLDEYTDPDTGETYTAPFGYYYNEETGYFERETYDEYYFVGNDENGEPIYEPLYTEYWTQEKAEYVVEDLPNYITELASLFDLDSTVTELLTSTVTDLLESLYTTDTIDMLLDLIQPLIIKYTQDNETVAMVIDIVVELDIVDGDIDVGEIIDHLLNYSYEAFEDGDRDEFVAVIVDFLEPLVPVLDFLLLSSTGTETGSISVYDGAISVNSYDGYTSALVPVLEALGCDSEKMLSYDEFATSSAEEKIYAIVDPICDLLDTYLGDTENEYAIYSVLEILPNILYFIEYGGLNSVISNILRPVYVVLDTIRPIYNVQFALDIDVYDMLDTLINDLIVDADIGNYVTLTIDLQTLISELLKFGYTETKTSVTGETYEYFVLYEQGYSEMLTVVLNAVVDEIVFGEDIQQYINLLGSLGDLIGTDSEIGLFLTDLATMESGDQVLLVLYYIVYGLEYGTGIYDSMSSTVKDFLIEFIGTDSEYFNSIFDKTNELLTQLGVLFGGEDYDASTDEVLNWFQQLIADIKAFFESLFSWLSI